MNPHLQPLSQGAPDALDLELLLADAIDDPDARARVLAAASGPLAAEAAALAAAQEAWAQRHRPLLPRSVGESTEVSDREPAPRPSPAPRPRAAWLAVLPLLAAAAALLIVSRAPEAPTAPSDPGVRAMGAAIPLSVIREGRDGAYQAGERLTVRATVPPGGAVVLLSVQAGGSVTLIEREADLPPNGAFSLDGALLLDDSPAREWLVLLPVGGDTTTEAAQAAARALLPDPVAACAGRCGAVEITRGRQP